MAKITLQVIFRLVATLAVVRARSNFQFMKFKFSQDNHLSIPVVKDHIVRLPAIAKGIFASPILGFGKKDYNDIIPVYYNAKPSYETTEFINYHQRTTANTLLELDENILNDNTSTLSDDFTEATTEIDTTTDLWTTTEDYENQIASRIAVSSQVVATLLG